MSDFDLDKGFDFGFTTHSNTEFIQAEEAEEKTTRANNKAQLMYNAILPLLTIWFKTLRRRNLSIGPTEGKK